MKIIPHLIFVTCFSAHAQQTKWVKIEAVKVRCDALRGIVSSETHIVAFFPNQNPAVAEKAYRKCLMSTAQARQEDKSVMISIDGDVVAEDGNFVRQEN